ncbi:MAG: dockerin type I domain-containing protein [Bacillota bacterium]
MIKRKKILLLFVIFFICFNGLSVLAAVTGDLDGDGSVNSIDFSYMRKHIIGDVDVFPVDKVKLDVYSDGPGEHLKTIYVSMGETVEISYEQEDPFSNPPRYYITARKKGYYTNIYSCEKGDEITVDLKEVDSNAKTTGVMIVDHPYYGIEAIDNVNVTVYKDDNYLTELKTDENGIYSCDLDVGEYIFLVDDGYLYAERRAEITTGYQDIIFPLMDAVDKPNIYLYPEETMTLDVELEFPNGGKIAKSIPEYGNGWHDIVVEPDGTIDGEYRFLFYESQNLSMSQFDYGWIIAYDELEEFFRNNMEEYGFNEQEIDDFIDYWIEEEHLPDDYEYYQIYPQLAEQIENEIILNISEEPDSIIRLIYTFVGTNNPDKKIREPEIEPFDREGFVVTEWGGILK